MIVAKIDILDKLLENGYSSTRLIQEKILASTTVQALRQNRELKMNMSSLNRICLICGLQPGDIIELEATDEEKIQYFRLPPSSGKPLKRKGKKGKKNEQQ